VSTPRGHCHVCGRQSEHPQISNSKQSFSLEHYRPTSPELPGGWFDWIKPFFAITDDYILNNCSLDGFFFLRFLRVMSIICLVGCCISYPILLPVNGTGGSGEESLDSLTIGNIKLATKFYAHVVVAWCFFGDFNLSF
jgi:hypothetical protein